MHCAVQWFFRLALRLRKGIVVIALIPIPVVSQTRDLTLAWDPNAPEDGVLLYAIYMDEGTGFKPFDILLPSDRPRYTARGLMEGRFYAFYVTAMSAWGESEASVVVSVGDTGEAQRRSIRRDNVTPRRGRPPKPRPKPRIRTAAGFSVKGMERAHAEIEVVRGVELTTSNNAARRREDTMHRPCNCDR
jgi:hypothetical protein